ncbi:hypothetical protein PENSOL_c098G03215 [Penicillium solitum]|uniref:Uncharacterized protein n=1 Tax=Penicillium solitum TaxID=60172 RepID=A0A1V6Q8Q5_9EURO|nr:uncharacterized protein PENSOL_c098G03215 [Penicillium solitum]OQD85578.1 hypothetical protein PENSOL_c098G03215 [Penicillium solitum]
MVGPELRLTSLYDLHLELLRLFLPALVTLLYLELLGLFLPALVLERRRQIGYTR